MKSINYSIYITSDAMKLNLDIYISKIIHSQIVSISFGHPVCTTHNIQNGKSSTNHNYLPVCIENQLTYRTIPVFRCDLLKHTHIILLLMWYLDLLAIDQQAYAIDWLENRLYTKNIFYILISFEFYSEIRTALNSTL